MFFEQTTYYTTSSGGMAGRECQVERGPEAGSRGSREAWHVQSSTTGTWTLQKVWQKWDQRLPEDVQIGIGGEKKHQKHQEKWGVRQVQLENL